MRGADLHMAQLMLLPLTVSLFSKIQIGFTFLLLLPLTRVVPDKGPLNGSCVCVRACVLVSVHVCVHALRLHITQILFVLGTGA